MADLNIDEYQQSSYIVIKNASRIRQSLKQHGGRLDCRSQLGEGAFAIEILIKLGNSVNLATVLREA